MYKFKENFSIFVVAAIAICISGCGGNNQNQPPQNTTATFSISNFTASNFTEVSIQNGPNGEIVYQGPINCVTNQTNCMVYYAGSVINQSAILAFKNQEGKVSAYYDTANPPGNYVPAEVTGWTTGAYLYQELINLNPQIKAMDQVDLGFRWRTFTQNYSNNASSDNVYEQLSAYYIAKQATTPQSLNDFLSALGQRLINFESAQSGDFEIYAATLSARALLRASSGGCPTGVSNLISVLAQMAGEKWFGKIYKPIAKEIGKAGADACKAKDGTSAKLDAIINSLNNLQNSVDNLQNDLGKLSNFVATAQMDTNAQSFEDITNDLIQLSKNYEVIRSNESVSSLKEYVVKRGGTGPDALRIALEKDGVGSVFENIVSRISSTSDKNYLLQIASLTGPKFNTLTRALDFLCANPSIGDMVQLRSQCNLVIGTTLSRMVAMQAMAATLAGDTYELFEAYPSEATRYGYDLRKTAAQYKVELNEKFTAQSDLMANSYLASIVNQDNTKGAYATLNGLSQTLVDSMSNVDCFDATNNMPLISAWIKEPSSEYLITNCLTSSTIPVQSRYYWKLSNVEISGRDDVMNVLGVLVPYRFAYNNLTGGNSWYNNLMGSPSSSTTQVNMLAFRSSSLPAPGTFAHSPYWATRMSQFRSLPAGVTENPRVIDYVYDNRTLVGGGDANSFIPYLYPWSNNILDSKAGQLRLTLFNQNERSNKGFTAFRHTDDLGFSYVFIDYNYGSASKLICLMGECTGGSQTDGLSFKQGPQKLSMRDADGSSRKLFGWAIGGQFIDGK